MIAILIEQDFQTYWATRQPFLIASTQHLHAQ